LRFRPRDNTAEIEDVEGILETEKALLCGVDGREVWIPKTQIHEDSEVWKTGDKGHLVIPTWLAEEKGLV